MAVLFRPKRPDQFGAMAGVGHEGQFAPPRLSGRSVFSKETFAGKCGDEKDAP
jgi:hypothetical protein